MYLIKDIDEYNLLRSKKYNCRKQRNFFRLKHLNIKYFYKTFGKNNQFNEDLCLNWYRDYNGNDLTKLKKFHLD